MEFQEDHIRSGTGYFDPEKGGPVFEGLKTGRSDQIERVPGPAAEMGYKQNPATRIGKVGYSHDAMIDMIIADPRITQNALAAEFGYSVPWVSRVIGSDAFQAALAKRRSEVTDPFLVATVEERLKGLALQSIDILAEKLMSTQSADLALKTLDATKIASTFGARNAQTGSVTNNFVVALPGKAPSAEQWADKALAGGYLPAIEHQGTSNLSTTITRDPTAPIESITLADSEG